MKITGLDALRKSLGELDEAITVLNQPVDLPTFNCDDPVTIEGAIAAVNLQIDSRTASYYKNDAVQNVANALKVKYRDLILATAASERISQKCSTMPNDHPAKDQLEQLQNAVHDIMQVDFHSAEPYFEILDHLLRGGGLAAVTARLTSTIDFDTWMTACEATQSSFVGSGVLKWPFDALERLGLQAKLIENIASRKISLTSFCITFFHSGNSITLALQKFVTRVIVPFLRDYRNYAVKNLGIDMDDKKVPPQHVGHQVNLYNSNVAALQTGDNAVANVTMSVTVPVSKDLIEALEAVAAALARTKDIPGHDKQEIVEMVEESKGEILKEKPNKSKIKSYLSGIAMAISALADAKPAYDLLVLAAGAAGYPILTS